MGADGHVVILDYNKTKAAMHGNEPLWYKYEIFGNKVCVGYYGDSPIALDDLLCLFCGSTSYDDCTCKAESEKIVEQCKIAEWEVWT